MFQSVTNSNVTQFNFIIFTILFYCCCCCFSSCFCYSCAFFSPIPRRKTNKILRFLIFFLTRSLKASIQLAYCTFYLSNICTIFANLMYRPCKLCCKYLTATCTEQHLSKPKRNSWEGLEMKHAVTIHVQRN